MERTKTGDSDQERFKSLSRALTVLNEAADDSALEIRSMVNADYGKLRRVFTDTRSDVRKSFGEMKEMAGDSIHNARDKVLTKTRDVAQKMDRSLHENPWSYLGGIAAASVVAGFILGRKGQA